MTVRAKGLMFSERKPTYPGDLLIWECNTSFGLYCVWQYGETWLWDLYSGEEEIVSHNNLASLESAQTACQVDFDRLWREATEVPDLVWEKCTRPNGSYFLRCNQSGVKYRVGEDSIGVYASIDDGGKSDITDLRIPKTEADAIAACNAHNRAAVLGE